MWFDDRKVGRGNGAIGSPDLWEPGTFDMPTLGDVADTSVKYQEKIQNENARWRQLEDEFDTISDELKSKVGEGITNPYRLQFDKLYTDPRMATVFEPKMFYEEQIAALEKKYPDAMDWAEMRTRPFRTVNERAQALDAANADILRRRGLDSIGGMVRDPLGTAAMIGGGLWGTRLSPDDLAANFMFGFSGSKSASIILNAIKGGLANAGAQALLEPGIQMNRKAFGLDYGIGPGMADIGGAFVLGAGLDAGFRIPGRTIARLANPNVERGGVFRSVPEAPVYDIDRATIERAQNYDIEALKEIATKTGVMDDPAVKGAFQHMETVGPVDMEAKAFFEAAGIDTGAGLQLVKKQIEATIDPDLPPVIRTEEPLAPPLGKMVPEDAMDIAARFGPELDQLEAGLRAGLREQNAALPGLVRDAFEAGFDEVVPVVRQAVEDLRAGKPSETIMKTVSDAALKLMEDPMFAARVALHSGRLDDVQAAGLLRQMPQLSDQTTGNLGLTNARALKALDDSAWSMVQSGEVPPFYGVEVADSVPPALQADMLRKLKDAGIQTPDAARRAIADLLPPDPNRAATIMGVDPPPRRVDLTDPVDGPKSKGAKEQVRRLEEAAAQDIEAARAMGPGLERAGPLLDQIQAAKDVEDAINRALGVQRARTLAERMLPADVRVDVVPDLVDPVTGRALDAQSDMTTGHIQLAEKAMNPEARLGHEGVHTLVTRGQISPDEVRLLASRAADLGVFTDEMRAQYRDTYAARGIDDATVARMLDEEAAAHVVEAKIKGKNLDRPAETIVQKVINVLRRIAVELGAKGYRTADDVARAITRGEMARRAKVDAWMRQNGASPQAHTGEPPVSGFPTLKDGKMFAIRAYHGSPHDFDKFDMSKIGTGEGAQAFGHGLYFAENEGVARSYRTAGGPAWMSTAISQRVQRAIAKHPNDMKAARESLHNDAIASQSQGERQMLFDAYNNFNDVANGGGGRMYEVRINAEPEQFLDWDKPRDQLSPRLREWAAREHPDVWEKAADGSSFYQLLSKKLAPELPPDADSGWTSVVQTINDTVQRRDLGTEALKEAGIKGIRYLDQGSRTAGEGSRNYVVFDDSLIEIVAKDGQPVTPQERADVTDAMTPAEPDTGTSNAMFAFGGEDVAKDADTATTGQPITVRAFRGRAYPSDPLVGYGGTAVFASSSPEVADVYAGTRNAVTYGATVPKAGEITPRIYPVEMAFQNPLVIDMKGGVWEEIPYKGDVYVADDIARIARDEGHDGLILKNLSDGPYIMANTYAALQPNTVRSVTANDMMFALADTNSPEFKSWFRDSKVVDRSGKPLRVFHGGVAGLEQFTNPMVRMSDFLTKEARARTVDASFFTSDRAVAQSYRRRIDDQAYRDSDPTGSIYEVYLSIQNPLEIDMKGAKYNPGDVEGQLEAAKAAGHDGMIVRNIVDDFDQKGKPTTVYVTFDPRQIKSVNNSGAFDATDHRFMFALRDEPKTPGLDMSKEARMKRAQEMGFDTGTVWYHGTKADIAQFDGWSFFSDDPQIPNAFARKGGDSTGGNVIPAYKRGRIKEHGPYASDDEMWTLSQAAEREGYDGASFAHDGGGRVFWTGETARPSRELVVFDPRNIRSVNAAFDPANADSPNLMFALRGEDQPRPDLMTTLAPLMSDPQTLAARIAAGDTDGIETTVAQAITAAADQYGTPLDPMRVQAYTGEAMAILTDAPNNPAKALQDGQNLAQRIMDDLTPQEPMAPANDNAVPIPLQRDMYEIDRMAMLSDFAGVCRL